MFDCMAIFSGDCLTSILLFALFKYPRHSLLIADNLINQKMCKRLLNKLGFHPAIASNGAEAVDAVRGNIFDIVLMDLHMYVILFYFLLIYFEKKKYQRLPQKKRQGYLTYTFILLANRLFQASDGRL